MNRTVLGFRNRNAEIMEVLSRIRSIGLTSKEAQRCFFDSRDMFLSHFEDENRIMHPLVMESAKEDFFLSKTVQFFFDEVDNCLRVVNRFLCRYQSPGQGLAYAEEFGAVYASMLQRVRLEEHAIYNIYEEQLMKNESKLRCTA